MLARHIRGRGAKWLRMPVPGQCPLRLGFRPCVMNHTGTPAGCCQAGSLETRRYHQPMWVFRYVLHGYIARHEGASSAQGRRILCPGLGRVAAESPTGGVGGAGQPYHCVNTLVMVRSVEAENKMTPMPTKRQEQAVGGDSGTGAHNLPVVFCVMLADKVDSLKWMWSELGCDVSHSC